MDTAVSQSTVAKRACLERATYTLAEFAALLGIGYTTAHLAAQAGTLPVSPIRIGRQYVFPKAAVHELLSIKHPADRDAAQDAAERRPSETGDGVCGAR